MAGKSEVWFSVDVEADGPIPGPYSMVSLGVCVAGVHGETFKALNPELATYYVELKPISDQWDPEALAVSGLDRDGLIARGADPKEAMTQFAAWVKQTCDVIGGGGPAVFCAYPLGYDWMWVYHYLMAFAGQSPFSHGRHVDMKTLYAQKAHAAISRSTKRYMPKSLLGERKHTHNALDDAQGQAELLANLMAWDPTGDLPAG
jgi:hypothetical protein